MARIPNTEIERLKQEISLQRLVESHGIQLKQHGQDYIGLCPFHDDKEPSLVITPKKNLWHCLGACQTGGSVIDWVMQMEGISFRHAVELLQADYQPSVNHKIPKRGQVRKLETFTTELDDQQLLQHIINYYHQALKQSPEALAYLKKRGLQHPEVIDTFKLGLSDESLTHRIPIKASKAGRALREQLQRIGLFRQTGHQHFNGSLVIPITDEHGTIQEVYGRKLAPKHRLRKGTPLHLYLPGPHQGLFNSQALIASKEIILCESLIDALTFWCAGYRNVTSSYGIEGFTKEHLNAFKQNNIERVLIAYDRDDAGNAAADKLAKQLIEEGIDCYRLQFPKGMDANEYALEVQPTSKSLGVVIRSAEWMGNGKSKPITTTAMPTNDVAIKEASIEESLNPLVAKQEDAIETVLPATPVPDTPKACPRGDGEPDINTDIKDNETIINFGERRYRIRGLKKNLNYDVLKINLLVSKDGAVHVDTFDLYQSRPRASFIKQAAIELGLSEDIIKADIGKLLLKLELLQDEKIKEALGDRQSNIEKSLSDKEQQDALTLLKAPDLLSRIINDFNRCGIVGEKTNTLVGYLSAVSRKLDNPLAVIIQSTSAAGKSSLMDAVLRFIPEDDKHQYSAMTGQSLYYLGETNLKHKVLAIAEEEGAAQAAYALKLLQSEGQLTIASTTKDPESGDLTTKEYKVEGPVMLFLTTTAIDIDEELMNRCLVLTVNEDREQTEAIHQLQRQKRTLQGLKQKSERATLLGQHKNAQRLLKPLAVVNPYAEQLTFLSNQTRTRRDHEKYLTLIDSIALLHQYQREIKTINHNGQPLAYVEVALSDIEMANQLAHDVLGRTLDELPPQTRKLLTLIDAMVREYCQQQKITRNHYHFSRRALREQINWSDTALKVHLARLVEMEYLITHRRGHQYAYRYELIYDGQGQDNTVFLPGLIDIKTLKRDYDGSRSGQNGKRSGSGQPPVRGQSGDGQGSKNIGKANNHKASSTIDNNLAENAYIREEKKLTVIPTVHN